MVVVSDEIKVIFKIIEMVSKYKLGVQNEKILQGQIAEIFIAGKIPFFKEYRLDDKNIPDFYIRQAQIAVEIKIKGSKKEIYKQCERYSKFDQVKEILLITNRSMGFPEELNGKPCYVVNLGKAWL